MKDEHLGIIREVNILKDIEINQKRQKTQKQKIDKNIKNKSFIDQKQ
jgi:hypothetical protein